MDFMNSVVWIGYCLVSILVVYSIVHRNYRVYKLKKKYKNLDYGKILYDVIMQKKDIPVIGENYLNRISDTQIEDLYERNGVDCISKRTIKSTGEVYYDIRGTWFCGLNIADFMKYNNIKPEELFYCKNTNGDINTYYILNGKYFELAYGWGDDIGPNLALFEITEETYLNVKNQSRKG